MARLPVPDVTCDKTPNFPKPKIPYLLKFLSVLINSVYPENSWSHAPIPEELLTICCEILLGGTCKPPPTE